MATQEEITFGNYETTLLISPETQEMDVQKVVTKLQNQIAQKGGKIFSTDIWGKQRLAYPIGKFEFGYYATLAFSYPTAELGSLTHDIKLMPEIIRHLAISLDKEGIKPENMKRIDPFKEAPLPVAPTMRAARPAAPALRTRRAETAKPAPEVPKKDEATRLKELEEKLGKLLEEE
jgi:small subunit ribosomal protein S6